MTEKFDFTDGAQFDPGFIGHLSAFVPTIEHIYSELYSIQNFNRKKLKFKMYHARLQNLIDTYLGFYLGCILWAACIKDLNKPILNNLCFGGEYNEDETVSEVKFVRTYLKQYQKDVKYYLAQDYKINPLHEKILDEYEEFLKLNKGFNEVKETSDIKVNGGTLKEKDREIILDKIANVIENGNFKELYPLNEVLFDTSVHA